jgi:hypothetical protein
VALLKEGILNFVEFSNLKTGNFEIGTFEGLPNFLVFPI